MKKYLRDIEVTGRLGLLHPAWAGRMFPDYINFTTLYNGSFDEIIDAITVGSPTLVPDPQLTALAILARFHLYDTKRIGPRYTPKSDTEKLLGSFSLGASDLVSVMHVGEEDPFDENPQALKRQLQKLNEYFRALLYYSTILIQNVDGSVAEVGPIVAPSMRRLLAVETKSFNRSSTSDQKMEPVTQEHDQRVVEHASTSPPRTSLLSLPNDLLLMIYEEVKQDQDAGKTAVTSIVEILVNKRIFNLVRPLWLSRLSVKKPRIDQLLPQLLDDSARLCNLSPYIRPYRSSLSSSIRRARSRSSQYTRPPSTQNTLCLYGSGPSIGPWPVLRASGSSDTNTEGVRG
ncbi:hypothetical protein JCM5350_001772 [Sporobolomyces pararoseus]